MECFDQHKYPYDVTLQNFHVESSNYFRYELASIARLESLVLGIDRDLPLSSEKTRWIKCLREMFVHFENIGKDT